jgi:inhibitor of KinA
LDEAIDGLISLPPYKIFPLGDSAITIDFGNLIDEEINKKVISLFNYLQQQPISGMIEAVPGYSSLTILYDVFAISQKIPDDELVYDWMKRNAEAILSKKIGNDILISNIIHIPVCYDEELGTDLKWMSEQKKISVDEIIQIHCSKKYRVYMLGFLPGFAYMGEVDDKIAAPRKSHPQKIIAGSVGIAGKQTGIYPLNSPGGWQVIGRTPLKLFDANRSEPCLLIAGNEVEFHSITKDEFENYQSRNS